jgi:hypothetical protein
MFLLVYQRSLKKMQIKSQTVNQLYQIRNEASIKYKQALLHQKQKSTLLEHTVKLHSLIKPLR